MTSNAKGRGALLLTRLIRPRVLGFVVALVAGTTIAFAAPQMRVIELMVPQYKVIEPYGQDTNGDGIATTAEGSLDIDGDGVFGEAEAKVTGLRVWIKWRPKSETAMAPLIPTGIVFHAYCQSNGDCFVDEGPHCCVDTNDDGNCDITLASPTGVCH